MPEKLTWSDIREKGEAILVDLAGEAIPGRQKMNRAIDALAEWADDHAGADVGGTPLSELGTDAAIAAGRAVLRFFLQSLFNELRAAGRV